MADDDQALTVAHGALDESADENKRLFDALTAAEARVRELGAALREVRGYFPADLDDALCWDFNDDEDRDDAIAMRRHIDALLATAERETT